MVLREVGTFQLAMVPSILNVASWSKMAAGATASFQVTEKGVQLSGNMNSICSS